MSPNRQKVSANCGGFDGGCGKMGPLYLVALDGDGKYVLRFTVDPSAD